MDIEYGKTFFIFFLFFVGVDGENPSNLINNNGHEIKTKSI